MSHQDAHGRIAFIALIATLVSIDTYLAAVLARQQPFPWAAVAPYGALTAVGLIALPLVWWHQRPGYVGGTAFGVLNLLLGNLLVGADEKPAAAIPQPTVPLIASTVAVSMLVVLYGVRAWREHVSSSDQAVESQTRRP